MSITTFPPAAAAVPLPDVLGVQTFPFTVAESAVAGLVADLASKCPLAVGVAQGVKAYPTDALALHAGDAAGGDLAGTYPNPSVAPKVPPLLASPQGLAYFPDTLSARLDAAFGTTVGTVIQRDTGGWVGTAPPGTANKFFVSGASGSPASWKTLTFDVSGCIITPVLT